MKRITFSIVWLSLLLFLTGCATTSMQNSYVSPLPANDAISISRAITDFLSTQWPPASSTVLLVPPEKGQDNNVLTPVLTQTLIKTGFAIGNSNQDVSGAHRLQYWVTPLGQGILVRLTLDNTTQASCFYGRDATGNLQAGSPFTVRK